MADTIMQKIIVIAICILLLGLYTGCVEEPTNPNNTEPTVSQSIQNDHPLMLPNWEDNNYHDYYKTTNFLKSLKEKYPDIVHLFSIGKSVQGKYIWCIKITNELNNSRKFSCLIDGSIHGNEWESGEACLYLAEYLIINFGENKTVTTILNNSEIYIVPLFNPDGREANTRWNDNGVDLNRNFDIFFGKLRGRTYRLGKLFGIIKIPYIIFPRLGIWFSNCGRRPFSEPETQAIRDLMKRLEQRQFSFYVNCHTAVHVLGASWLTFKPPFQQSQQEQKVLDHVLTWVETNTEYEALRTTFKAGGLANDWCFKEFNIPSFNFEILSQDYEPFMGEGKHDHLVHWMKTTLPVFLYLLVNIEYLHNWEIPENTPYLPEGVPPVPI